MATYRQNINKIKGEAIYGKDVREAIADALDQAVRLDVDPGIVFVRAEHMEDADYRLEFYTTQ